MEQASSSIMTGIRALSAHLPLVYFQVNTGVSYFLNYVEDVYDGGPLCSL